MEIKYNIIRSNRKTVGICIKNGAVTVRAPYGVSQAKIEEIVNGHMVWIEKKLAEGGGTKKKELSEADRRYLRALAERELPALVRRFCTVTGLEPKRVRISSAKSRFGSCSDKGSISLSYYVMMYPEAARELVVVHELCHLRFMDHSKDFYSLLSKYLPDHKARKKLLRDAYCLSMEQIKERYGEIN